MHCVVACRQGTHGPYSEWGEHEIDYILFIRAKVDVKPNPEEASDVKYVTLAELQTMMAPSSGLLWSPWFRIIVEKFLIKWWKSLDAALTTDKFLEVKTIHRFEPPAAYVWGNTNTQAAATAGAMLKQGAYGKVKRKLMCDSKGHGVAHAHGRAERVSASVALILVILGPSD